MDSMWTLMVGRWLRGGLFNREESSVKYLALNPQHKIRRIEVTSLLIPNP